METVVKIRSNLADKIMQGLGLALMVGVSLYLIIGRPPFAVKLPMHYGAAGEIDRWGGKGEILFLVVLWWIMYLVISAVETNSSSMSLTASGRSSTPMQMSRA